jgi:hypothetical protein
VFWVRKGYGGGQKQDEVSHFWTDERTLVCEPVIWRASLAFPMIGITKKYLRPKKEISFPASGIDQEQS